ncbi:MAG TPA: SIMPL domain-containing protein [Pyrinomonadaceae bacterium]|nr:SIMPL domain-containing protein [Pyrinomonadaceae bacterium]
MLKRFSFTAALACVLVLLNTSGALAAAPEVVRGRLGRTVEAGGWVISAPAEKFLILNASRFAGESWFREGAEVEAEGERRPNAVTIFMEGTPFEARTMRPAQTGGAGGQGGQGGQAGTSARELTRVTVTGDSLVQARPDTAVVTVAVVTQNASASEAQAENASRSEAVVRAVKAAAGAGAEVQTTGYSLQPQYAYREGAAPQITSYVARNGVTVTLSDLTRVGAVIDAASRAGANNVEGLSFTLRRDEQVRRQALAAATREALDKARAIAEALGGRVVRVVAVEEAGTIRPPVPVPYDRAVMMKGAESVSTPVEPGQLDVRAQVQIAVEVEARP